VQPDAQRLQPPGPRDGVARGSRRDHQARRGQNAAAMGGLDRVVDFARGAEIIGGNDQAFQTASRRDRRKWKNSTPSLRRRFMISGLVNISATIEAILEGRD